MVLYLAARKKEREREWKPREISSHSHPGASWRDSSPRSLEAIRSQMTGYRVSAVVEFLARHGGEKVGVESASRGDEKGGEW